MHLVWPTRVNLRTEEMTVFTLPYCLAHPLPPLSVARWLLHWVSWAENRVGSCYAIAHHCPPQTLLFMAPGLPQRWSLLMSPTSRRFLHFQETTSRQELHLHVSETNSVFGEPFLGHQCFFLGHSEPHSSQSNRLCAEV